MSKISSLKSLPHPAHITTPAPCPPWCARDEYAPAWPVGDDYVRHSSREWTIHRQHHLLAETFDVVVQMDRFDEKGEVGATMISVGAQHYGTGYEHPDVGSLDPSDQMTPNVARQLAAVLLAMADAAETRTEGPELAGDKIDEAPLGERVDCVDCMQSFDPDSSPHEDRCWECAAVFDGEVLV